jgi:sulfatase modifying factor 1
MNRSRSSNTQVYDSPPATRRSNRWLGALLIALALVLIVFSMWWKSSRRATASASQGVPATAAPVVGATRGSTSAHSVEFQPTVQNNVPVPADVPPGMVWIPGGEFSMGAQRSESLNPVGMQATEDSRPIHRVYVDGFWMDKTDVTNAEFAKFVKATKYVTVAERKPKAADFPGAPPENLVAGAVIFSPPDHMVPLDNHYQWWSYMHGANWRHPEGPTSSLTGRENFPVVDIAYEDAVAYAKWAGKRLPTEAEWEFAARGGLSGKLYAWGDEFRPGGKWMANTHQGQFPVQDTGEDGHIGVSEVALFPANGYGLYDMSGNVWQWTSDWYRPDYYERLVAIGGVTRNPTGPSDSYDPGEPSENKKVQRGGSFLCTDQYCSRYMVGTRGKGEASTGTNHLGFRCVIAPAEKRQLAQK